MDTGHSNSQLWLYRSSEPISFSLWVRSSISSNLLSPVGRFFSREGSIGIMYVSRVAATDEQALAGGVFNSTTRELVIHVCAHNKSGALMSKHFNRNWNCYWTSNHDNHTELCHPSRDGQIGVRIFRQFSTSAARLFVIAETNHSARSGYTATRGYPQRTAGCIL